MSLSAYSAANLKSLIYLVSDAARWRAPAHARLFFAPFFFNPAQCKHQPSELNRATIAHCDPSIHRKVFVIQDCCRALLYSSACVPSEDIKVYSRASYSVSYIQCKTNRRGYSCASGKTESDDRGRFTARKLSLSSPRQIYIRERSLHPAHFDSNLRCAVRQGTYATSLQRPLAATSPSFDLFSLA